ncbi:MAG TPA: alkaline phosphatase family protein [Polyangia bacterium]|nr:alkaline phosphatase family protein [Polyangia bacterium]
MAPHQDRAAHLVLGTLLAAAAACQTVPSHPPVAPPTAGPSGRLLVAIVVDQLGSWLAEERWPELDPAGGFARLRREGLTVRELRYPHAVTDTAPGHAALFTGVAPRGSGIVANEIIGPGGGDPESILADAGTRLVAIGAGPLDRPGSSLAALKVETLADVFKSSRRDARVYSFSLKDRGALFAGGRRPDAVLWLDPASGAFVTSTAFATSTPDWLRAAGDQAAVAAARAPGWTLSDGARAWVAAHAATPDDQRGEGNYAGLGRTFPHAIPSAKAMRATPAGDQLLFGLAEAALAHIAADRRPTLLALSLSSHDYVAHVFGPDSWEAWDELRQLDARLAAFLGALDRAFGPDGYDVLLTGDHGGSPLPELAGTPADRWCRKNATAANDVDRWQRPCGPRHRIVPAELARALEGALVAALGAGPWVTGIADPLVFLGAKARALDAGRRQELIDVVRRVATPLGIAEVVDLAHLDSGACAPPESSRAALVCAATRPGQPGDLYLLQAPGTFFDPNYTPGFGTSHGTPYLYDRAVPLLVRAPGRVRAGAVIDAPVPAATFTRTAAALLGVRAPAAADPGDDVIRTMANTRASAPPPTPGSAGGW